MRFSAVFLTLILLFTVSCVKFVMDEDVSAIKEMEKKQYILKKDIVVDGKKMKKGTPVGIVISTDKDWIKVHGYPKNVDPLKADRILLLFLFEDDFEGKRFSMSTFKEKLGSVIYMK